MTRMTWIKHFRGWLIVLALVLCASNAQAENDTTASADTFHTQWFKYNALKVGPAFFGSDPKGAILAFETSTPSRFLCIQFSVKYFAGGKNSDHPNDINIRKHWRFEIQGRYYPIAPMQELYFAPLVNYYDDGGFGIGGMMGYQFLFGGRIPLDLSVGIQSKTKTDNYDSPIFLRLGLFTGWAFPKVK